MLAAPFFSFVTKQTNLYYTMMEDFLQQYCKYLENALDSRVVVVLDGSGTRLEMDAVNDSTLQCHSLHGVSHKHQTLVNDFKKSFVFVQKSNYSIRGFIDVLILH